MIAVRSLSPPAHAQRPDVYVPVARRTCFNSEDAFGSAMRCKSYALATSVRACRAVHHGRGERFVGSKAHKRPRARRTVGSAAAVDDSSSPFIDATGGPSREFAVHPSWPRAVRESSWPRPPRRGRAREVLAVTRLAGAVRAPRSSSYRSRPHRKADGKCRMDRTSYPASQRRHQRGIPSDKPDASDRLAARRRRAPPVRDEHRQIGCERRRRRRRRRGPFPDVAETGAGGGRDIDAKNACPRSGNPRHLCSK